jgi:tetratricopeptide (TPR) repeat protein
VDPTLSDPHKNLGVNYLAVKQFSNAEKELNAASRLNGNDKFVHYYMVILYLATARDVEAVAQSQFAESLVASDVDTVVALAKAYLRMNRGPGALRIIDSLAQRSGLTLSQEYELATILSEMQMYSQAVEHFRRISAMQAESWISKYNLAIALLDAKQQPEALQLLESLVTERPADGNILSLLGSIYESAGKLPAALDAYRRAVAVDPENPDRYLDYTRLLMDMDRYDDAVALIQKGIQNTQDTYALNIRLGAVEMMKGENEKARECFQKAIGEHPDVAVGYVALAKAYMREGNDQAAADVLSEARGKLARDFALEYVFGFVSSQLGNTGEAIEALKSAEELDPTMVEPHYQLGKLYMEARNWAQAQAELERVILLNPKHAQAYFQLSKVYARMGDAKKASEMQEDASQLMKTEQDAAIRAQTARVNAFHTQ